MIILNTESTSVKIFTDSFIRDGYAKFIKILIIIFYRLLISFHIINNIKDKSNIPAIFWITILVLIGIFQKNILVAVLASLGVILAAAYMLWLTKRVIFGQIKNQEVKILKDVNFSEGTMLFILATIVIIFLR